MFLILSVAFQFICSLFASVKRDKKNKNSQVVIIAGAWSCSIFSAPESNKMFLKSFEFKPYYFCNPFTDIILYCSPILFSSLPRRGLGDFRNLVLRFLKTDANSSVLLPRNVQCQMRHSHNRFINVVFLLFNSNNLKS